jgi:hypothetical protein
MLSATLKVEIRHKCGRQLKKPRAPGTQVRVRVAQTHQDAPGTLLIVGQGSGGKAGFSRAEACHA